MFRRICKGKIHRARVTEADLNYVGSITIDETLMKAANILPYEMVQITNLSNAVLWHTYAIPGKAGSGTMCLNGPPARHFQPQDIIVVLSLGYVSDEEWKTLEPSVVFVDENNQITSIEKHKMSETGFDIPAESAN